MTRPDPPVLAELDRALAGADRDLAARYPGDPGTRQPLHTLYVPADQAGPSLLEDTGHQALTALEEHAGGPSSMAATCGIPTDVVAQVWPRLLAKLTDQPVEDVRLDLEDGYGGRPDGEEDAHATAAGELLAAVRGPVNLGVRMKSLDATTRRRAVRTLDHVLAAARPLPRGFVVTLPKVTSVEQVAAMVTLCESMEDVHALPSGALRFELQVETPQAVLGPDGAATVARMVQAGDGRVSGLHYGTYDYSAALGVAPAHQSMDHPVADFATSVLQVAAAGTGVRVSHGSTNVLPVGDAEDVRAAWALHARLVRRSLERGIYQGWDLHPAQLVTRYVATYAFYREGLPAAAARLRAYAGKAGGGVLDEPATAFALASFLLRGLDCGALDEVEVVEATGLDRAAIGAFGRRQGGVARLDTLPRADLVETLREVCTSRRWVAQVADARPYREAGKLLAAADAALARLDEADVDEALAGHPRIGERTESESSRREQSGVGEDVRTALAAGNADYEQRFGHVYLVCASGRTGEELLAVLRHRLGNDPATERRVLREELGRINGLRLQRLVEEG